MRKQPCLSFSFFRRGRLPTIFVILFLFLFGVVWNCKTVDAKGGGDRYKTSTTITTSKNSCPSTATNDDRSCYNFYGDTSAQGQQQQHRDKRRAAAEGKPSSDWNPFLFGSTSSSNKETSQREELLTSDDDDDDDVGELIIAGLLIIVVMVLVICFGGRFNEWSETIEKAHQEVLLDAVHNCERQFDENDPPLFFTIPKAKFEATYTDTSYDKKDIMYNKQQWDQYHRTTPQQTSYGILWFSSTKQQQPQQQGVEDTTTTTTNNNNDNHFSSSDCRFIKGEGNDGDGKFQIIKGLISPHTGKCYWVEQQQQSVLGGGKESTTTTTEEVLITGRFFFSNKSSSSVFQFQGQWKSKNGESGTFTRFDLYKLDSSDPPSLSPLMNKKPRRPKRCRASSNHTGTNKIPQ